MSYIVTARKWRPQFFRDVISQKHVTETLKNAIKSSRVGHAYLFSGPRGVGKTTVARIFAKALNCVHGPAEEPCNSCENCLSIQSGTSMDVQELDGASNNSVEDVRKLISNVGYHASHCRFKIYIVDEVHMLSGAAFNALLKTLEEPPSNVIFIFATTEPHKIPATILSRCQRFDFHRLSNDDIAGKLRTIAASEEIRISDDSIMLITQRSGGAMRDAESILEQFKSSHGDMITVADVIAVLGIADREVFFHIIDRCHEHDAYGAIEIFKRYYDEGGDLKEFVEGLLTHLRDLLYARYENGLKYVMLSEEMKLRIREQTKWYDQGDLIRMIGYITDVEMSLTSAVMPVLQIEIALTRMASMELTIQLKELFEMLGAHSAQTSQGNYQSVQTADLDRVNPISEAETFAVLAISDRNNKYSEHVGEDEKSDFGKYEQIGDIGKKDMKGEEKPLKVTPDILSITASWMEIAAAIGAQKPAVGPSLEVAVPEMFKNGKLTLVFAPEHNFHAKIVESCTDTIETLISALLGTEVSIKCVTRKQTSRNSTKTGVGKKNERDDLISREPIIKDILDHFDGEINNTWRE
ncbi:MAG TPA: DNA polymerase III subunit gamma/tau [Anaerolineae bacterium]|nr:DNA polymerase III subunit gamma/tau [Anaerolineae bacterium]